MRGSSLSGMARWFLYRCFLLVMVSTVNSRYLAGIVPSELSISRGHFLQSTYNRQPIARPHGRSMGCYCEFKIRPKALLNICIARFWFWFLWEKKLLSIVISKFHQWSTFLSLLPCMHYRVLLDRVISRLKCNRQHKNPLRWFFVNEICFENNILL